MGWEEAKVLSQGTLILQSHEQVPRIWQTNMKPLEYFEFENNYRFSLSGLGLGLAKYEYFLIVPFALDCIQLAEVHQSFILFHPNWVTFFCQSIQNLWLS